jgi:hypothetical protein
MGVDDAKHDIFSRPGSTGKGKRVRIHVKDQKKIKP